MKTRVLRQTVIDREEYFQLYTRKEFSIEETTELRSEHQINAAVSQQLATRGKRFTRDGSFYYIIKEKGK